MRPFFHPRLINGPFGDPGLYIPFSFENRAILVDVGQVNSLSPGDLMKVEYLLISHTHMDHFIGFDHLLRAFLGREKTLQVIGPEGIIDHVHAKLMGYTWNLVDNYPASLAVQVTEIHENERLLQQFLCHRRFIPQASPEVLPPAAILRPATDFTIEHQILDHGIPCLGFTIKEPFHIHILKEGLTRLKLVPGPWIKKFKQALQEGKSPDTPIEAASLIEKKSISIALSELAHTTARISRGQKITYIADAAFTSTNIEKILLLADGSDILFIEAAFLAQDGAIAAAKSHLTAAQAGWLAARAGVERFTLFHFSPRYTSKKDFFQREALAAYEKERLRAGRS